MLRSSIRGALAVCALACFSGATWAGHGRALGSIAEANNSLVDNSLALAGANVYACDVLDTDHYGDLRVQFGGSQLVLGTSSEVVLDGSPDVVRVIVISGSISFSSPSSATLVIDTPAGRLREASGQAYSGTVAITGPNELLVTAVRGNITLKAAGAMNTIPAGKSARITFEHSADAACHGPRDANSATKSANITFQLIDAGAAGGATYAIRHEQRN
ncbi:MAG: hypothetical protein KGL02_06000 [Acidobacteriota bacterium]|nr:hypothetical protein [Acidobacteriota bacterium]